MLHINQLASVGSIASDLTFQIVTVSTLTANQAAIAANFTFVQKYLPAVILAAGGTCRIRLSGPLTSGSTVVSAAYIGPVAASGNAYDFLSGSQVAITFGGGATSVTVPFGAQVISDNIDFTISGTSAILVALNVTSGSPYSFATSLGSNVIAYAKTGVSEAATAGKGTGYTSTGSGSGRVNIVSLIQAGN